MKKDALIIVRGGGDLATGTIHRLCSAGLRVLVLETTQPAAIRRQVALCEAVYEAKPLLRVCALSALKHWNRHSPSGRRALFRCSLTQRGPVLPGQSRRS